MSSKLTLFDLQEAALSLRKLGERVKFVDIKATLEEINNIDQEVQKEYEPHTVYTGRKPNPHQPESRVLILYNIQFTITQSDQFQNYII